MTKVADEEHVTRSSTFGCVFAFIIYLLLFYIGKNFTLIWQRDVSTCDRAIIWCCSVIPALLASIIFIKSSGASPIFRFFISIVFYVLAYIVIFVFLFIIFIVLYFIETVGIGFISLIALMLLLGTGSTVVIVIIK